MKRSRKLAILAAGILAMPIVGYYAICSLPYLASGEFFDQNFEKFDSPDGSLHVVASRRVCFPANEIVDPSVILKLEVRNAAGQIVGTAQGKLWEISDCDNLEIFWGAGLPRFMVNGTSVPYQSAP